MRPKRTDLHWNLRFVPVSERIAASFFGTMYRVYCHIMAKDVVERVVKAIEQEIRDLTKQKKALERRIRELREIHARLCKAAGGRRRELRT